MNKTSVPMIESTADKLVNLLAELPGCVVAFSGGVDSAVVAKAAYLALGERAVAVTGVSSSLASGELELARRVAQSIGIQHETVSTDELADPGYLANQPSRCWHCKTELYSHLKAVAREIGFRAIVNGANLDDQGDFRPGMQAARENEVRSPLIECGIDKNTVRQLAHHWELEVWDKPATPCLSSRVVYGLEITPERLERIDAAEYFLRGLGFANLRVRYHQDDLARLELSPEDLDKLADRKLRDQIAARLTELGFCYVTIDLAGFRSGSFQQLIATDELTRYRG